MIKDALELLNKQLKIERIKIVKSLRKNLPKIRGDQNQLLQVVINLINNARGALESSNRKGIKKISVKTNLSENQKNIQITIKDNGCGIPEEYIEQIFNPFFTTKFSKGGIGLGLSIAYRIIEDHKGEVRVNSQPNRGTAFKIILPVVKTQPH